MYVSWNLLVELLGKHVFFWMGGKKKKLSKWRKRSFFHNFSPRSNSLDSNWWWESFVEVQVSDKVTQAPSWSKIHPALNTLKRVKGTITLYPHTLYPKAAHSVPQELFLAKDFSWGWMWECASERLAPQPCRMLPVTPTSFPKHPEHCPRGRGILDSLPVPKDLFYCDHELRQCGT